MQYESVNSLAAVIRQMGAAENPEQEILKHIIAGVEEQDPELAEAIQYCAIPRRFDAEIIGVLRQAPDGRETNERLLVGLVNFSFVRLRPDGSYAYDDSTRDALIQDWIRNRRDRFDQLNQYLVEFYQKQYPGTIKLEQDLASVAAVVQKANQTRYLQLASAAETRVAAPLLEALYHETQRSADSGYKLFQSYYEDFENKGRLTICESLLTATRSYLERLPPNSGRGKWLRWLQYWKARLERSLRRDSNAEKLLRQLLRQLDQGAKTTLQTDETQLRLWIVGELGVALQQQWKLKEATEVYEQAVALAEKTGEDPYNLPVWHYRLAGLYFSLDELDRAELEYGEAIKSARDENLRLAVYSRLDLSAVLFASCRQAEAFSAALEALHVARTSLPQDRTLFRFINQQFMSHLARHDPRLLDTAFSEGTALIAAQGDSLALLEFHQQYLTFLRQSGQLRRADQELVKLEQQTDDRKLALSPSLLLEKAILREEQGRLDEVMSSYDELAQKAEQGGNVWHFAAALSNRGMASSKLARWKPAEGDLQQAITRWEEVGYRKLAAFVRIPLATVLRKEGRISEAQQILDEVAGTLGETKTIYLADYHQERGDLFRDQALTDNAREEYEKSLSINLAVEQREQAARILGELARLAADQGSWEQAQQQTTAAAKLWEQLTSFDNYDPTKVAVRADQANAKGMLLFSEQGDDRTERLKNALSEFSSACELVPENFWYQLNRAYACAELADWSQAIQALKAALDSCPAELASAVLYERLAEYLAYEGERILTAGDYAEASRFYAESKIYLAGKIAFDRQAVLWYRLGDSLLKLGELDKAEVEFRDGLTRLGSSDFVLQRASFHARVGFAAALRGDLRETAANFQSSIHLRLKTEPKSAVEDLIELVKEFSQLIISREQYRTFIMAVQRIIDEPLLDSSQRQRLLAAKFDLIRKRYLAIRRSPQANAGTEVNRDVPLVPTIAIEADAQLFPQDVATPEVKRMIEIDLPNMQQEHIHQMMGVRIPGVVIRANEVFARNYYVLSLDDVPLADGSVFPEKSFCPDVAKCRELGIEGHLVAFVDGLQGLWLAKPNSTRAEEAGLTLFDPYQYMVLHLELHLRRHLATFLGIQEAKGILDQWVQDGSADRASVKKEDTDDAALIRLVQVLQRLVEEDVPLRNVDSIMKVFLDFNSKEKEITQIVEEIRLALKSELPVAHEKNRLAGLSDSSETAIWQWITERDGTRFLAIPRQEADHVLNAMTKKIINQDLHSLALVVHKQGLRPFVRRLVETRFPNLMILARAEVPDEMQLLEEKIELVVIANTGNQP